MQHLKALDISSTEITDEGIYTLSRAIMLSLRALDISGNNIGSLALESLGLMQVPDLQLLLLKNCRLKGDALITINTFNMPNLVFMDLSYNDFEEYELIDFVANLDRKLLPRLQAINM
jgi:Leucine-rich repeat (LRR) protein